MHNTHKPAIALLIMHACIVSPPASAEIIYVDDDAPPGGDGLVWATAYDDLQYALGDASTNGAVTEIRVAGGTYTPSQRTEPGVPRTETFALINGVTISGGYAGLAHPKDPDTRDLVLYESTLSGDLNGDDVGDLEAPSRDENAYHVVTGSGTDTTAVLDGVTVSGGNADGSDAERHGAGLYTFSGSPTVTNCTFGGNHAHVYGGGMYSGEGNSTVTNCVFTENSANCGGGMYIAHTSSPTVTNCAFSASSANHCGGGIFNRSNSSPPVSKCRFNGNSAGSEGGGMYNDSSSPTLTDSTFNGNSARYGGGLYNNQYSDPALTNCTFSGNSAGWDGGGMYNWLNTSPTVTNCTFGGNYGGWGGGGAIYNKGDSSTPTVTNCVLWGNRDYGGGMSESAQLHGGKPSIDYSCIQGWTGSLAGVGNTGNNPRFVDHAGPDGSAGTEDDNLRLLPGSPCIDAGDNAAITVTTDLDGNPRLVDYPCVDDTGAGTLPIVDMGAYERPDDSEDDPDGDGLSNCYDNCPVHPNPAQADCDEDGVGDACALAYELNYDCNSNEVPDSCDIAEGTSVDVDGNDIPDECNRLIFVDDDAPADGDGTAWVTAYDDLQAALSVALSGDEIRVASGRYTPSLRTHATDPRSVSFRLPDGVTIRGGHAGLGTPDPDLRDVRSNVSILSGDLAGDDVGELGDPSMLENSYRVVVASGVASNCILDGFTITRGYAYDPLIWSRLNGGGIYVENGSPVIIDCTITANSTDDGQGGGIYCIDGSAPTIIGCSISDNLAEDGGGVFCSNSSATIRDCAITGNRGVNDARGGGLCSYGTNLTIVGCVFSGNRVSEDGGGMYDGGSGTTVTNCTFVGNGAALSGGGMCGGGTLTNCTFIDNWTGGDGGGLHTSDTPTLTNCILWGNTHENGLNQIAGPATVRYSNIQGGWEGTGNIDADPVFVRDPHDGGDGWGDDPGTPDVDEGANDDYGDLRLRLDSPCINAGDPAFVPEPGATDLDGHARVLCSIVDMGAYEFGIGDYDCDRSVDLLDYLSWPGCVTGPLAGPYADGCQAFDFDFDGDVDLLDFAGFQGVFEG